MTIVEPACTCPEHVGTQPSVVALGRGKASHAFIRESDEDAWRWRWRCGCGGRGRWQWQSPNVAYHSWLKHVSREEGGGG